MRIWIDADACPQDAKEILYRASRKRGIPLTLVANQPMHIPSSSLISLIVVGAGANVADQAIAEQVEPGDLVITADIPLAADVVNRKAIAFSPRGEMFSPESVGARLATRNLLDQLRGSGQITGGPSGYSDKDRIAFSNQLDRWLTKAGY